MAVQLPIGINNMTTLITIVLIAAIIGYVRFYQKSDYRKDKAEYSNKYIPKWTRILAIIGAVVYLVTSIIDKYEIIGLIVGVIFSAPMLFINKIFEREFDTNYKRKYFKSDMPYIDNGSIDPLDETTRAISTLDQFMDYLNTHNNVSSDVICAVISKNSWLDRTDEEDMICSDGHSYLSFDRYEGHYGVHLMG